MRALGFDVKKADVLKIMKDYDREASGKISFDDFNEVSKYGLKVMFSPDVKTVDGLQNKEFCSLQTEEPPASHSLLIKDY